jgi:hypothetical protein
MNRVLPLSIVHQAVRARVCAHCDHRSGDVQAADQPLACESTCPPIQNLPKLWDVAVRLDPMIAHVMPALRRALREVDPPSPAAEPGRIRRDHEIARTLKDLSGK